MESTGLWAAPLLLIPGVGLLVLSTSARFGQLHQELHRQLSEGHPGAVKHLCRRARLLHSALVSLYVSIAVLAISSLLGTLANRLGRDIDVDTRGDHIPRRRRYLLCGDLAQPRIEVAYHSRP